jgi:hypothetical protein
MIGEMGMGKEWKMERLTAITILFQSVHFLNKDFSYHHPSKRSKGINSVDRLYVSEVQRGLDAESDRGWRFEYRTNATSGSRRR